MSKKKTENQSPTSVQKPMFNTADAAGGTSSDFDRLMAEFEHIEAKSQAMEDDEARLAAIDEQTQRAFEQAKREEAKRKTEEERAKNGVTKKTFGLPFGKRCDVATDKTMKDVNIDECEVDYALAPDNDILADVLNEFGAPNEPLDDDFPEIIPDEDGFVGAEINEELLSDVLCEEYNPEQNQESDIPEASNTVFAVEQEPVNIPDEVMSNITTKELLRYWVEEMLSAEKIALREYYYSSSYMYNEIIREQGLIKGAGISRKQFTKRVFKTTHDDIVQMLQFIGKMTSKDLQSGKDIVIAIYGLYSDEAYVYREFCKCYDRMHEWDETEMFSCSDERLKRILYM